MGENYVQCVMLGFTNYMLQNVSWYWLLICTGFLVLSGYMAFGPYRNNKLDHDDEEPEFSTGHFSCSSTISPAARCLAPSRRC